MAAELGEVGGRVALVTGGSRGVGRETVDRLASRGYSVAINYVHDQRTAEATVDAVLERRGVAVAIRADVTDDVDVQRLVSETIAAFGGIDVVVHAVPSDIGAAPEAGAELSVLDELWRTTARATLIVDLEAARQLRPGGAIVNLSGSVPRSDMPTYGVHAVTTAAIDKLTETLALALVERDITVNTVSLDLGRPCVPGRVADVVVYLLSDEGHAITGQAIHIGGGWSEPRS